MVKAVAVLEMFWTSSSGKGEEYLSWLESPVDDRRKSRAIAKGRCEGQHPMARARLIYTEKTVRGTERARPKKKVGARVRTREKRAKRAKKKGSYEWFRQSFVWWCVGCSDS